MSKALKFLVWLGTGIAIELLAMTLWDSSIFSAWHDSTTNPITRMLDWLSKETEVRHGLFLALIVWSLGSFIYICIGIRRIRIREVIPPQAIHPRDAIIATIDIPPQAIHSTLVAETSDPAPGGPPAKTIPKPAQQLCELQERILDTIAHNKFNTAEMIKKRLQIGPNITEQQLEKLEKSGMIWIEDEQYGVPGQCGVMPPGRDYLIERGLLR